ncbi:LysR family transcriptional regulator [Bacillus timonensis]|uniref:LysR family transcriptional regulator n=1 Tax=Bacillus timonensis TaxID=1033734 RepID=UPI0013873BF9|nr:LysR family transcriptional regulator [Bacillus timonensis]
MDIRDFSYILAIIDNGNMTRAAEKLHISQPSLSIYIKNLEERLGAPLFERIGNKLSLTVEGKTYANYARQIVSLNNDLHQNLKNMNQLKQGIVKIGLTISKANLMLPKIFVSLQKQLPNISIRFYEASSEVLETKVTNRELDFILVNHPFRLHDLDYIHLFDEEFMIAISSSSLKSIPNLHTSANQKWLDIKMLKNENFILATKGQRTREIADYLFLSNNMYPHVVMETYNIATSLKLTKKGIGISFLPDSYSSFLLTDHNDVKLYSVGEPTITKTAYVIAFPHNCHFSVAAKAVIENLCNILPFESK